jgi:hypothetical protein
MTQPSTALANPDASRTGNVAVARLPSWALTAAHEGEPNSWWRAEDVRLSPAQRAELPAIIERARLATTGTPADRAAPLADELLKIAVRVSPGSGRGEIRGWSVGLLDSLAHYPADIVAGAIAEARRTQFQFLNEVGPSIGKVCAERLARRRRVLNRLEQLARTGEPVHRGDYVPIGQLARRMA